MRAPTIFGAPEFCKQVSCSRARQLNVYRKRVDVPRCQKNDDRSPPTATEYHTGWFGIPGNFYFAEHNNTVPQIEMHDSF